MLAPIDICKRMCRIIAVEFPRWVADVGSSLPWLPHSRRWLVELRCLGRGAVSGLSSMPGAPSFPGCLASSEGDGICFGARCGQLPDYGNLLRLGIRATSRPHRAICSDQWVSELWYIRRGDGHHHMRCRHRAAPHTRGPGDAEIRRDRPGEHGVEAGQRRATVVVSCPSCLFCLRSLAHLPCRVFVYCSLLRLLRRLSMSAS